VTAAGPSVETRTLVLRGAQHRTQLLRTATAFDTWLIVLHEGLGSIPQWRSFPGDLARTIGVNTAVYERRNHGGSGLLPEPRGPGYHAEEAEIVDELMTALDIERAFTYGHSDGATIALLHAAHHPDRVAAVVSEAGHVITEDVAREGILHARRLYASGELRDALVRYHGDHTDAMFSAWADTWLDPAFEDWSIIDEVKDVVAPVLAIQGELDPYGTPDHVRWIADAVSGPAETWVLPGIGHAPHREAGSAVVARVVQFLGKYGVV